MKKIIVVSNSKNTFFVLEMMDEPVDILNETARTEHIENDRQNRINEIDEIGNPVYSFVVETGHRNGPEIHTLTDKSLIFIQNQNTRRLVTFLFARPQQLKRYFENLQIKIPNDQTFRNMIRTAFNNFQNGKNEK